MRLQLLTILNLLSLGLTFAGHSRGSGPDCYRTATAANRTKLEQNLAVLDVLKC